MSSPESQDSALNAESSKFAMVAIRLSIMGVVLGVGAVLMSTLALLLGAMVLVEAAGTFYFVKRASVEGVDPKIESRARTARGIAVLAIVLALVGVARTLV
ncbi:hypothetical protein [Demequina aurantiaca]|uniref:hypothetical protein n=1 Tax=Demequina aurantiaca TaxID=676200 RepID=UPI000AB2B244|nr:hypothetical protein [Demequina aurantiaca]